MLVEDQIKTFLEKVASDSPAPGGGSVAALTGALGASLASMVSRLTIEKKGYEDVWGLFEKKLQEFEEIRQKLIRQVDRDTEAFNNLVEAFKMPKSTEEQKRKRNKRIQSGYKNATQVPLETARNARTLIDLLDEIALEGNENALSDIAVGMLCSYTALKSAALNVQINLPALNDEEFVKNCQKELENLLEGVEGKVFPLIDNISDKISSES